MELSDRKLKILSAVVNGYIQFAEPISSKMLCELLDLSLSSATIRNELAELTTLGLLEQPHTSAGRIPSNLGYRLYINKLMGKYYLTKKSKEYINSLLDLDEIDPEIVLKNVTSLLANMTNFAVVCTSVCAQEDYIKNVKLIKFGKYTAMIILTTSSGLVKNRLFRCEFLLRGSILEKFNNILSEKFVGVSLKEVTPAFIQTIAASLGNLAFLMTDVFEALFEISKLASKTDIYFDGQTNLLSNPEYDQKSAIKLMSFLNYSDDILDLFLLNDDNKTHVFIGEELHHKELDQSSIIVTKYMVDKVNYGLIGIVGPTRMNYTKLIANLEYIASLVGDKLNNILDGE